VKLDQTRRSGPGFLQVAQFILWNDHFRQATFQTNNKVGEYKDGWHVDVFHSGATDARLRDELVLVH
jgi:hypothetical protein